MMRKGTREILTHIARLWGLQYKEYSDVGYLRNDDLYIAWHYQKSGMYKLQVKAGSPLLQGCEYDNINAASIPSEKVLEIVLRTIAQYKEKLMEAAFNVRRTKRNKKLFY